MDLDATALQFTGSQLFDLAFYNNLKTRDGSVEHLGDNKTGSGEGDDEQILVDLSKVHGPVDTILFLVSSYQGHSLEWVANAYCRRSTTSRARSWAVHAHLVGDRHRCGAGPVAAYAVRMGAERGRRGRADHGADAGTGEAEPLPVLGLAEQQHHGLGHAGGLVLALDLDRVADDELLAGGTSVSSARVACARIRLPTLTGLGKRTLLRP